MSPVDFMVVLAYIWLGIVVYAIIAGCITARRRK